MTDEPQFTESSGNVFAELGLPDAGTRLAKAELARRISLEIEARQRQETLIGECLMRGAPRAMMTAFFGLSREKYVQLRAAHGIRAGAGRAPTPPPSVEREIYERWIELGSRWSAPTLLQIAVNTEVSLRVIWDQLRRFKARRVAQDTPRESARAAAGCG